MPASIPTTVSNTVDARAAAAGHPQQPPVAALLLTPFNAPALIHCRTASRSMVAAAAQVRSQCRSGRRSRSPMATVDDGIGGDVDVTPGIVVLPDVVSDTGGDRLSTGDVVPDTGKNQNGK
jgi:hypothetical protein